MLTRVVSYMTRSKGWLSWGWNRIIDDGLARVGAFRSVYPAKLRAAAADLQRRLLDTLAVGMTRIQRKSTKNAEPHVVRQDKVAPPRRISGLSDEKIREILDTPRGQRPDPSTYMTKAEIDEHLARFDDGAVRFRDANYDTAGPPGGSVMPKNEFEAMVKDAGGDLSIVEDGLGFDPGHLTSGRFEPVLIEAEDFNSIRIPSGNEGGANDRWLPGGFTSGGQAEAVMDFTGVDFTPIILD
ncbi:MAG: hypothetical protein RID11_07535 [Roseovarius sp.]